MYCTICGKMLPDDAVLCPQCGAPVDGAKPAEVKTAPAKNAKRNPFSLAGFVIALVANVFLSVCTNIAVFTSARVPFVVLWIAMALALVGLGLCITGLLTKRAFGAGGKWLAFSGIMLAVLMVLISIVSLAIGSVFNAIFELYGRIFY